MHLKFHGVNDGFRALVECIHLKAIPTVRSPSRVGDVLQIPEPVMLTYDRPLERVLFNGPRDANPFFHLYEALWMLAGRNDVAPLAYYSGKIGDIASDDGQTFNGSYGYRWRHADTSVMERDQLDILIEHLHDNPQSRRAVLQMWNVEDDLMNINESKDVCCNLCVCFSLRHTSDTYDRLDETQTAIPCCSLDMTVFNRSNDLIWGSLGANFVHFTLLQEYIACALGVSVGVYNQVSNNLHCYTELHPWTPEEWLADSSPSYISAFRHVPLVNIREMFDQDVKAFVELNSGLPNDTLPDDHWEERFLCDTAQPMMNAFHCHKERLYMEAIRWASSIEADDWRIASLAWINKRRRNWEKRNANDRAAFEAFSTQEA